MNELSAAGTFTRRVGTHAAIYATAPLLGFVTSIVNLVVLTRLIDRPEYGRLAVLLVFSSMLTVLYNVGSIQGTFRTGFAPGVDDADGDGAPSGSPGGDARRGAVGTGILFTAAVAAAGTIAVWALAGSLASTLLDHEARTAIVLAAVAGGLGAVWRLVMNLLRLERRPLSYVSVHSARPLLALLAAIPLVLAGYGVAAVMAGWAIGTAASLVIGLRLTRPSYRLSFSGRELKRVFRAGAPLISVAIGFWVLENADIFVLSGYVSNDELATYRVAARVATLVAYVASAYLMAWGPLSREPIYLAAERERGPRAVNEELSNYMVAGAAYVLLFLAVFGNGIAALAPQSYAIGVSLILLLGCRWAAKAFFQLSYRTSVFPRKGLAYALTTPAIAVVFVVLAIVLVPRFGGYGAAAAAVAGPLIGAVVMLVAARHARDTRGVGIAVPEVAFTVLLAGGCVIAVLVLGGPSPRGIAVDALILIGFPVTLVAGGIVPWSRVRGLFARPPWSAHGAETVVDRFRRLERSDQELVRSLAASGPPVSRVDQETLGRFVAMLRNLAGLGPTRPTDAALGEYLVFTGSAAERDQLARSLWLKGVDPLEVDVLTQTVKALRSRRHGLRDLRPRLG